MAFRAKYFMELKKRANVKKLENKRNLWLSIVCNQFLPLYLRRQFLLRLRATRNYSAVRVKNRCIISNRSKSVIRFFQMSRIVFRQLAREGVLVGVKRSSW